MVRQIKCDRGAQAKFFNEYSKKMFWVCRSFCDCDEDAEDVMMEGFEKVFSSIDRFRGDSDRELYCWVRTIMVNHSIERKRWRMRKRFGSCTTDLSYCGDCSVEYDIASKIDLNYVIESIGKMPHKMGMVLKMREIDGMEYNEIADHFNTSESNIRVNVCRARKWLQQHINEY